MGSPIESAYFRSGELGAGTNGVGGGVESSAIDSVLASMDVSELCQKYFLSLKKSHFISFIYLVEITAITLLTVIALFCQVSHPKRRIAVFKF